MIVNDHKISGENILVGKNLSSVGKLFSTYEIAINGSGRSRNFKIGPRGQILALGCGITLLTFLAFMIAVILSEGWANSSRTIDGIQETERLKTIDELTQSVQILEQQVTSALALADMALSDKADLELMLAEQQLSSSEMNATVHPQESSSRQVAQLITALETSIDELAATRAELAASREENASLVDSERISRIKARRTIARLSDAIALATSGLETQFKRLGLDINQLKRDVIAKHSGQGGLSVYVADPVRENSFFQEDQLQDLFAAIGDLNIHSLARQYLPLGHPVKRSSRFTSPYGMRKHPITHKRNFHAGADFAAPIGTPIHATGNGVVTFVGWKPAYGRTLVIRHAGGTETLYAHLSKIRVKKNERVWKNQHVADMGSTGMSTGSHLHYEVRIGGQAINPMKFIKAESNVF